MDHAGTFIRTIQYKGRTASLIIKVHPLSGVQKQVSSLVLMPRQLLSLCRMDMNPDCHQVIWKVKQKLCVSAS